MSVGASRDLEALRARVTKGLIGFLWLHVLAAVLIGAVIGADWAMPSVVALALAGSGTGMLFLAGDGPATRLTIAVALVGMVSIVVWELSGLRSWQVDMHMYFFAMLAILAAYCDWQVLLIGAGATAVHHLVLNFLLPEAVYPGGGDFGRVVLHAVIVVIETGVLMWLGWHLASLFARAAEKEQEAEAARRAETEAAEERAAFERRTKEAGRRAMSDLADAFQQSVLALVADLFGAAEQIRSTAERLSVTAHEAETRTAAAASASQDAASGVATVSTAAGEMTSSAGEITRSIGEAQGVAGRAVGSAEEATRTVQEQCCKN